MSTFSPNLNIEEVARGGDVGTWDTPTNSNWTLMDSALGAITTISLNNANVVLNAGQFQSKQLTFNSTLTGSVTITFATSFIKSYEIQHLCTGSSAFTITLETTATGGQVIAVPPGEIVDVVNDGTNLKFKNLGRVGTMVQIYASSMPNWVSACTVQPYLQCAAVQFSSATYPVLAMQLGSTTTPDLRGRVPYNVDGGAGRITGVIAGTLGTGGGDQNAQAHTHTASVSDPGHLHTTTTPVPGGGSTWETWNTGSAGTSNGAAGPNTAAAVTGISVTNATALSGGAQNLPPLLVSGITMIRAG
jgi:hypothetical protein